ncbi:MAG: T9SS type A sorting domain-containing protein [Thermaurantimonas sp.]
MKKSGYVHFLVSLLAFLSVTPGAFGQTNPPLHVLANGDYTFTQWAATEPATTYPSNMRFWRTNTQDPTLSAAASADYTDAYNLSSGTRINGLGQNGFSFINTGTNGNLGMAVVGLNATGRQNIQVSWTGGTFADNPRIYAIRLQYRIGTSGTWTDVLDASNNPIQYQSNPTAGHSQSFGPTPLPAAVNNQQEVYVRWFYYYISGSGARPQLRVDDITITSDPQASNTITTSNLSAAPVCLDGTNPQSVNVEFTFTGTFTGTFTAELSDATGDFTAPVATATGASSPIALTIPATTPSGTGYRVRVSNNNPSVTGFPSSAFSIVNGVLNVTNLSGLGLNQSALISWVNPAECYDDVVIVVNTSSITSAPSGVPTPASLSYTDPSNPTYGGGNVIVYRGSASPQTITGLTNNTTYYVKVFTRRGSLYSAGTEITVTPFLPPTTITSIPYNYSQDFNSLAQSGQNNAWTDDITISGWYWQSPGDRDPNTSAGYTASDGTGTGAFAHSFGSVNSSDRAMGGISGGNPGPRDYIMGVRFRNTTGAPINLNSILISYTGEQWRQTANIRTLEFSYLIVDSPLVDIKNTVSGWIANTNLNFTTPQSSSTAGPLDGNAPANRQVFSNIPLAASGTLPDGHYVMMRWYLTGTTSPGVGIDDFSLSIGSAPSASTYYNKPTGDLNVLSTWGTNPDGTGTAPTSFTAPNQTFIIANGNPGIHYQFQISGTGSKVVVGDGINQVNVSLDPTASGQGEIIAPIMDIAANAIFTTRTNAFPQLGSIAQNSTFRYTGPSNLTLDVAPASYGRLELLGSATKNLPDANFTVNGNLTLAGTINTNATGFRTITFNGDSIKLNSGVNMQPGNLSANTTHRNTNIEFNSAGNQYIWSSTGNDTLRIGRLISTKSSGSLTIEAPVSLFNRMILNYTGTAVFNDGGSYLIIGDNVEANGLASAYNLTGTIEIRRMDGSGSNHNLRRDGAINDNPPVCEFNNLIINTSNQVNFRPTNSIVASYTVKGNLQILSSANLVDLGTNNTLQVNGAMTIASDTLVVSPGGRLQVQGTLTNNGVIELRASASNGAALLRANGAIPNVRVSQHIEGTSGSGKWIHMRMPVDAPLNSVVGSNAIMFIDNNTGSVYNWNAGTANFEAPATATASFGSAPGWVLYVGENSFGTFVNTLPANLTTSAGTTTSQSTNVNVPLLYNDGQSSPFLSGPVTSTQGWNLIANPWTTTFDIAEGELNASPSFGIHVYRNGAYDTYHHANNTGNSALRYIPLGQAFWVQRAASPATQNFTFKTNGITLSNPSNLAKPQSLPGEYHFTLRSVNSANGNLIKTYVSARDLANDAFVMHEDVVARRHEAGYQQFYSMQDNVSLAINTHSKLLNGSRVIPLYFEYAEAGTFRIEAIDAGEQDEMYTVFLEDRHTNTFTDLYKSSYAFQHHPSIEVNRFNLHINASSIGQDDRSVVSSSVWTANGHIFIKSEDAVPLVLEITDLTGRVIFSTRRQLTSGVTVIPAPVLPHGVYVIRVTTGGKTTLVKTIF